MSEELSEQEKDLLVKSGFAFFRLHTAISMAIKGCEEELKKVIDPKGRIILQSAKYTSEKIDSSMHDLIRIYEIDINKLHELSKKSEIGQVTKI